MLALLLSLIGGSSQPPTTDGVHINVTNEFGTARTGCTIAPSWDNRENIHRTDNHGNYTFTPSPTAGAHKVTVYCGATSSSGDKSTTQDITVTGDAHQVIRVTVPIF